MSALSLILELAAGAAGGNLAGKLLPKSTLGTIGNSIAGIVGGGLGGQILGLLGMGGGDAAGIGGIIGSLLSGGVGGGVLMALIGLIKGMLAKK
jgi:uncharacterized membrane protein YeaQ/YmgE (transglycosylase-associated protein family)